MNTNIKNVGIVLGIVLIVIGILGFIPALTPGGQLFGLFAMGMAENVIYIVSGLIIGGVSLIGTEEARRTLQVFGVLYAIYLILGLIQTGPVLGFVSVDVAANILHLIIAIIALGFGFGISSEHVPKTAHAHGR